LFCIITYKKVVRNNISPSKKTVLLFSVPEEQFTKNLNQLRCQ